MDDRERRIVENEVLFRSVNEQVHGLNQTLTVQSDNFRVVCECGLQSCIEQIELHPRAYEKVRANPTQFFIRPGHEFVEAEEVVSRNARYWVIRKLRGVPAALARAPDPRG